MKKKSMLIICITMFVYTNMYSQLVTKATEKTDVSNVKYMYAVGIMRFTNVGKIISTTVEFGKANFYEIKDKFEYQKNCKAIEEGIDLINYMSTMGWELVQVVLQGTNEIYYFKRKI